MLRVFSILAILAFLGGCAAIDNPDCWPFGVDQYGDCRYPEGGSDGGPDGPAADGPAADGPAADGPAADGPAPDGPSPDSGEGDNGHDY